MGKTRCDKEFVSIVLLLACYQNRRIKCVLYKKNTGFVFGHSMLSATKTTNFILRSQSLGELHICLEMVD